MRFVWLAFLLLFAGWPPLPSADAKVTKPERIFRPSYHHFDHLLERDFEKKDSEILAPTPFKNPTKPKPCIVHLPFDNPC